ncbi:MAG: TonB-dependent receptor [candidate division KSB1 bacterium]|nr:TonB-dependent receptor [candidate division KSB1 bacterium]
MKKTILALCFFTLSAAGQASATQLQGTVYGVHLHEAHQDTIPLVYANIYWQDTTVGTTSDSEGRFRLPLVENSRRLIVRYVGYKPDTLTVLSANEPIRVYLSMLESLGEVTVEAEKPHALHLHDTPVATQRITQQGLRTLACCNLAESFENTMSVDVEQTDAVSGAKRIKLLGLAGFYTQFLIEKNPTMRGLISPFSLEYIPGFWIESIDISKGTASVVSGYESITGQINVELKKPEREAPIAVNLFQNDYGRSEASFGVSRKVNDRLSTLLLAYGSYSGHKSDTDNDTFVDMPLVGHISVMNRWKLSAEDKDFQLGVKLLYDDRDGGQTGFSFDHRRPLETVYATHNRTRRTEWFAKAGTLLSDGSSLGLILSGFGHRQDSFWGNKTFDAEESSLYANLIYEKSFGAHAVSTGLSFLGDNRLEVFQGTTFEAAERVPGAFLEYTYKLHDHLTAMAGFRYDRHNLFGSFYTPRFHLKLQPISGTSLRFSAGKGYRIPHIFVDNPYILAASRELVIREKLQAEEAWNAGVQLLQEFRIGRDRPATLSVDFYRTDFLRQVIVDLDQNSRQVVLYNLDGRSFSNSAQVELTAAALQGLDVTAAYRYNDVRATYAGALRELPLNPRHKGLLVFSYTLPNRKWRFDVTTQFNGEARLPDTRMNPPQYRLPERSPSYEQIFVQVTRKFSRLELYAGIENLTDYRQVRPILAWQEPFSPYFDSSLIWGPTMGRRFYAGLRFN